MNDNHFEIKEPVVFTYYHPLEDLNLEHISQDSKDRLLRRDKNEIKILTYNIFMRPPLVKNNENDWKDERLSDFLNQITNYDIICLQEMFGSFNSRKQMFIRAASLAGFFFYVDTNSPSFISKYMVDGGLLIISRFPIVETSYLQFRYGVVADSLAEKGIIYTKIKIKNSSLHLFTTHLQASYFDSTEANFLISFETRMAQIKQINHMMIEILKTHYNKKKDKILLVGDLNVDALEYKHSKLTVIIIQILKKYINKYLVF
jgi:endonuclease/exonuclease/phosphatase family metal-dependent hydrolase